MYILYISLHPLHLYEYHVSAIQKKKKTDAWIPQKDGKIIRSQGVGKASIQRTKTSGGMKKQFRLRDPRDFQAVFKGGRRKEGKMFRVVYLPNRKVYSRFAFIAPRSVDKRAVGRNTLRRRAREWVRGHLDELRKPLDVAVIFKKEASLAARKNFYEELARIFGEINT